MSSNTLLILVFYPMAGAILSYVIGRVSKTARDFFADFIVISEFLLMLYSAVYLEGKNAYLSDICGMGLHFNLDGFRGIYGCIAAFMWMMTIIFSREYFKHYRNRNRYYLFNLVTLGATIGVFLSGNLYTTFIFFEIMSFTSYVWVAQDEKKASLRAAETYLAVAIIGGMVLLMGLFLLYHELETLEISGLFDVLSRAENKAVIYAAGGCMLFGFGAKAGAFALHIWLPKAHPVAPAPASALLSGILTKTGVCGMLIISSYIFYGDYYWGCLILALGTITMFLGALLAVFSVDLKRTLACSSMSQIGFIMVGIGMQCLLAEENGLAVYGTFLHMMNHSLFKLVLFMIAGVVYMNVHKLNLNEIRGFGRHKPFLNICFLMGALGIGGIPLWSGYISKTLLHESIVEYSSAPVFKLVEWVFLISGGMTLAYMSKLYISIFIEKNRDEKIQEKFDALSGSYMNLESKFAIGVSAIIIPVLGIFPNQTMIRLAKLAGTFLNFYDEVHVPHFLSAECLKGAMISVIIGAIIYLFVIRKLSLKNEVYLNLWPSWLDLEDLVYRPLLLKILPFFGIIIARIGDCLVDTLIVILRKTVYKDRKVAYHTGKPPALADVLGTVLDREALAFHLQKEEMVYRIKLRKRHLERAESTEDLKSYLSYGLTLSCVGIVAIFIYILFF